MVVSTSGITFQVLDGAQAAAHADDLLALHAEVYAEPPYGLDDHDAARFTDRFRVQRRQPGFVLAEARHGGYLVGYAMGMPLRPSTSWWRDLTTALPGDVTAEHPGRTFALADLVVRASWRRQGIGRALHDLVLAGRPRNGRRSPCRLRLPRRSTPSRRGAGASSRGPAVPVPARPCPTSSSGHPRPDNVRAVADQEPLAGSAGVVRGGDHAGGGRVGGPPCAVAAAADARSAMRQSPGNRVNA